MGLLVAQRTSIYLAGDWQGSGRNPEIPADAVPWPLLGTQPLRNPSPFMWRGREPGSGGSAAAPGRPRGAPAAAEPGQVPPRAEERGRQGKRVSEMSRFESKERC